MSMLKKVRTVLRCKAVGVIQGLGRRRFGRPAIRHGQNCRDNGKDSEMSRIFPLNHSRWFCNDTSLLSIIVTKRETKKEIGGEIEDCHLLLVTKLNFVRGRKMDSWRSYLYTNCQMEIIVVTAILMFYQNFDHPLTHINSNILCRIHLNFFTIYATAINIFNFHFY